MQGATINKMSCGKIRKDLARPDPGLDGCVCASKMWVSYLGIEANSGMACPYSGTFPYKVGNHSSCSKLCLGRQNVVLMYVLPGRTVKVY